jgi:hypothetical protein
MNFLPLLRRRARRFSVLATLSLLLLAAAAAASAATSPIGEQKTAVILVNFQDDASQPITVADAYSRMFGTVSDMYWEASYQKTFFSGNAFGWYTIPVSKGSCDIDLIAAEADKAATAAGVSLAGYARLVYLVPQNACSAGGYNSGHLAVPSRTWIKGNNFSIRTFAHEMGHSFGMSHSQGLDCGAEVVAGSCVEQSAYDPTDTMGAGSIPHFDAVQKELLGWLGTSGQPPITTASASGSYTIAPYETPGSAAKVLKIAKGIDAVSGQMSYYYLEYRQPTGFDAVLASLGNLTTGVLIHVGGADQLSKLLDLTPGSQASSSSDFYDAALTVGRSFTDSQSGVAITLVSASASGAVLDVRVGSAAPPPPPSSSPLSESVGTNKTSYLRGETVSMSALVSSNGTPVSGASVKFTLGTPGGGTTILNATSGSDGYARSSYKLGKTKTAIGSYGLRADASSNGGSATASTSFSAQ